MKLEKEPDYALGRTSSEHERLTEQGELLWPMTERMLRASGITPGMRVLDVGCGAGDVSLLLSDLIGCEGGVVGVDVDADAIRIARERCTARGIKNATFVVADARSDRLPGIFDAAVGRLVLMYMSDPTESLRAIATHVRPGGVIAFLEWVADISPRTLRDLPVLAQLQELIRTTHARCGAFIEMGAELFWRMRDAGLHPEPRPLAEIALAADEGAVVHRRWALGAGRAQPPAEDCRVSTGYGERRRRTARWSVVAGVDGGARLVAAFVANGWPVVA